MSSSNRLPLLPKKPACCIDITAAKRLGFNAKSFKFSGGNHNNQSCVSGALCAYMGGCLEGNNKTWFELQIYKAQTNKTHTTGIINITEQVDNEIPLFFSKTSFIKILLHSFC